MITIKIYQIKIFMIKRFDTFINEEYAFPTWVETIRDYLVKIVYDKFDMWLNRKNPANYKDEFIIHMADTDIPFNKDFPLAVVTLSMKITRDRIFSGAGGTADSYRSKYTVKDWNEYSHIYRGKIYTRIGIDIWTGKKSIEIEKIKDRIESTMTHELEHVYQGYKQGIKGINPRNILPLTVFANYTTDLMDIYPKCDMLRDLLMAYYPFVSAHEHDALMSEFNTKAYKSKSEVRGFDTLLKIRKMDFDTLYNKILKEFKRYYSSVDVEKIPGEVMKKFRYGLGYFKLKQPQWTEKYDTDFKSFLKLMYDKIIKEAPKFIKKSDKVFTKSLGLL